MTENIKISSDEAARRLTELLEAYSSFSFLRMGDGELRFLLEVQEQKWKDGLYDAERSASCEIATGTLGLRSVDYERLLASYQGCGGLDLYLGEEYNKKEYARLRWARDASKWTVSDPAASKFIYDWTRFHLKLYASHHKCLFCGAEAALFRELLVEPEYRRIAGDYLPAQAQFGFYEPPERGRNASANLDKVKQDLKQLTKSGNYDTVFICYGGPAKILCFELAREMNVRTIDWGSMLRAMTYSGSDGQATWRASHNPFFFRVPLPLYLNAMRRAWPDLTNEELLGKAHAQLCLELQRKAVGLTLPADVHDPDAFDSSPENEKCFLEAYDYYRRSIRPLARTPSEKALVKEMERWRLKKGLGARGRIFRKLVHFKGSTRKMVQRLPFVKS